MQVVQKKSRVKSIVTEHLFLKTDQVSSFVNKAKQEKKMNKVTLIANNSGGLTLQVQNGEQEYQHYYNHVTEQAVDDLMAALSDDDTSQWEGNDASDGWTTPSDEEIRNGGYRTLRVTNIKDVIDWGVDSSWNNIVEISELSKASNEQ